MTSKAKPEAESVAGGTARAADDMKTPWPQERKAQRSVEKEDGLVVGLTFCAALLLFVLMNALPTRLLADHPIVVGVIFLAVPIGRFAGKAYIKQRHG